MQLPFELKEENDLVYVMFPDGTQRPASPVETQLWNALDEALDFRAKVISDEDARNAVAVLLMTSDDPTYLGPEEIGRILGATNRFPQGIPLVVMRHGETLDTLTKERKEELIRELTLYDKEPASEHGELT